VIASLSITWVTERAAGYTAFALLTASVALGLLLSSPLRPTRWPRFATTELHRFVTLLTLVFIAVHVLVALLDRFIGFTLSDVLIPFTSNFRTVWMGLGIVSAYLAAALWASSWLQRRIGYRWWRRLHFGTFAVYVGAALHGMGTGSDTGWAWSWIIYVASFALVGGLLVLRLPDRDSRTSASSRAAGPRAAGPRAARPSTAAGGTTATLDADRATLGADAGVASALAHPSGPALGADPCATSAVPVETRAALGAGQGGAARSEGLVADPGFSARLHGRMWRGPDAAGGTIVQLEGSLYAGFDGDFQLRIHGWTATGSSRLRITDNHLWLRSRGGAVWWGQIDAFDGMHLRGEITPEGHGTRPLAIEIELLSFADEAIGGSLRAMPQTETVRAASPATGYRDADGGPGQAPPRAS
jgi:hypothetical protein